MMKEIELDVSGSIHVASCPRDNENGRNLSDSGNLVKHSFVD
jgi:hypothetical protein